MEDVLALSFAVKGFYAALAVALLYAVNRLWNHLSGNRFDDAYRKIVQDPGAAARYHGFRFLGIAVLVGLLLS